MRQHTFLALATKAHYVENTSVIRQDSTSTSSRGTGTSVVAATLSIYEYSLLQKVTCRKY